MPEEDQRSGAPRINVTDGMLIPQKGERGLLSADEFAAAKAKLLGL